MKLNCFCFLFLLILFSQKRADASEGFEFASESIETKTGLSYNRARFYDFESGAFISKDPIGIHGGLNTYEYCASNPINFIDPSGLEFWT